MRIPAIRGVIDRRILANYRIDPAYMAAALPPPFRPKITNGYAIGGICLIRLVGIRPKLFPLPWGIRSENAAHRIAVEWDVDGKPVEGVYIPRRDSDSRINALVGGRIFPGVHHHAQFTIAERDPSYAVSMTSNDGSAHVYVSGRIASLPDSSTFGSLAAASDFFERGSLGYSDTRTAGRYDGLELRCPEWQVEALDVDTVESSYFEDQARFPAGTVEFDCALLMRNIAHEWHGHPDLTSH